MVRAAESRVRLCRVGLVPNIPGIPGQRNRRTRCLPTRPMCPPTLVGVLFCKPRFDADITVWIGPRLLSSGLEVVDERLPLGITSGQLVLEHVSTDDMAKSTVYSLPPVRFFCQAHGDRVNHILTCSVPWSSRMRSSICASSQRWAMALR